MPLSCEVTWYAPPHITKVDYTVLEKRIVVVWCDTSIVFFKTYYCTLMRSDTGRSSSHQHSLILCFRKKDSCPMVEEVSNGVRSLSLFSKT